MSLLQDVFPNYGKNKEYVEEDNLKEYRKQLKQIIKTSSWQKEKEEKEEKEENKEIKQNKEIKFSNYLDTEILYEFINDSILLRKDLLKSQSNLESLVYIFMIINIILTVLLVKIIITKT